MCYIIITTPNDERFGSTLKNCHKLYWMFDNLTNMVHFLTWLKSLL
jgi:hypothetical protein